MEERTHCSIAHKRCAPLLERRTACGVGWYDRARMHIFYERLKGLTEYIGRIAAEEIRPQLTPFAPRARSVLKFSVVDVWHSTT